MNRSKNFGIYCQLYKKHVLILVPSPAFINFTFIFVQNLKMRILAKGKRIILLLKFSQLDHVLYITCGILVKNIVILINTANFNLFYTYILNKWNTF